MGGWSEYMVIIPEAFVYKVPGGIGSEIAVYSELLACAFALDKVNNVVLSVDEIGAIMRDGLGASLAAVSPASKLTTTWSQIKQQ